MRHFRIRFGAYAGALAFLLAAALPGNAENFAQFRQNDVTAAAFSFTSVAGLGTLATTDTLVDFSMVGAGDRLAFLTMSETTTLPAIPVGPFLSQPFNNAAGLLFTMSFRDATTGEALLDVRYQGTFLGTVGIGAGSLNASSIGIPPPNEVFFDTHGFVQLDATMEEALSLSFTAISPLLGLNLSTGFLNDFTASGTGTFSATEQEVIPEPGTMVLAGIGLAGIAAAGCLRRKSSKAA
jgi:hypothetical protein